MPLWMRRAITAPLIILSLASSALAGTFYISPTGNDTNSGTDATHPWLTFAHAKTFLVPGTTLDLLDGTYTRAANGFPDIDCNNGWSNGTAAQPITIQSLNERKGYIRGDGQSAAFRMRNCSYWNIAGLHVSDADALAGQGFNTLDFETDHHLWVHRNIADHSNRCQNAILYGFIYGNTNILFEENEAYYFHRHPFYFFAGQAGDNNEARRNYTNNRGYSFWGPFTCPDGSGTYYAEYDTTGQMAYGIQDTTYENNISENIQGPGSENEPNGTTSATYNAVGNIHWLGNVNRFPVEGIMCASHSAGDANANPFNISYIDDVAIVGAPNGSSNVNEAAYFRSCKNVIVDHATLFVNNTNSSITGMTQDNNGGHPGPGPIYSTIINTELVFSNTYSGPAYNIANGTASITNSGAFNAGTISNVAVTNPFTANPGFGACYLWAPMGSAAKNANIGATILYAYENGILTTKPLWNTSGQFAFQGAIVSGVNDVAGDSLFDVGTRLHVNSGGCSFPAGYVPSGPSAPPSRPNGLNFK